MRFTAKQISKDLEVSEATVSLVFNNKPGVSEKMRKRVNEYADELRRKNEMIQNRYDKNIKVVSFMSQRYLYDKEQAGFHTIILMELTSIANKAGYNTILVYVHNTDEILNMIKQSALDRTCGFVLLAADMKERHILPFRDIDIPSVVCDFESETVMMDYVYNNNQQAVTLAMQQFIAMGHREIFYLYNSDAIYNFSKRREAFQSYMKENDHDLAMLEVGSHIEDIYSNIVRYIKQECKIPTAVLAENYAVSIAAIKAFQDCGYRIGKDISIIGIDKLPSYMLMDFELTYIEVLFKSKGRFIIERLLGKMREEQKVTVKIILDNFLVEGNSVHRIS